MCIKQIILKEFKRHTINIFKEEPRPLADTQQMNDMIIRSLNAK